MAGRRTCASVAALSGKPKPKSRFVRVIVGVVVFAMSRATESYSAWVPCPDKINLYTGVLVVWI